MFERTDPKTLMRWLLLAALLYLLIPYDLVPDFFGLPGRIDDLLVMAGLAWLYRSHLQQYLARGSDREAGTRSAGTDSGQGSSTGANHSAAFDPYEVLGVSHSASQKEIQAAYRSRMQQYHPDKVAHLGEALQKLAHEKSAEIQRAYRQLHG